MTDAMTPEQQKAYDNALQKINEAKNRNTKSLDLSCLNFSKLPAEIGQLTSLKSLNLSGNQLSDLPQTITQLASLKLLILSGNQLSDVPQAITQLTSLQSLDLSLNQLNDLPQAITQLTSLQSLNLNGNQLSNVPQVITQLTSLQSLALSRNQLSDLPQTITQLTALKSLVLSGNQLSDLPQAMTQLTSLLLLNLSNNQIKVLPKSITDLSLNIHYQEFFLSGTNLYNNPLEIPPVEIVKQGREAIKDYYDSLDAAGDDGIVRLYEGKLLIVGEGKVGKTFLANRLMFDKTSTGDTTEGIDIHKWMIDTPTIKDFRVNLWDFAGQQIDHATHQLFLTARSLYLFVWEARTDQDMRFDYWLNIIKLLSNGAPVLMVMNKCDVRIKAIDQAAIQKEFPNVIGFYEVSAERGDGISELRQRIHQEMQALPMIGTKLPKQWVDIRSRLESMQKRNYIEYREYEEICSEFGLNTNQAANLAQYYHDLGVILHYKDEPMLENVVILNPEWATDAVYAVIDNMDIQKLHGRFHRRQLESTWADYPNETHLFLIELMKKFELCFELDGAQEYIVPELLSPKNPGFQWDDTDNLCFEYKYTFMPAGIITRFTVRQHEIIDNNLYWKNGVCLKWNDTKARIICDPFNRTISINIKGVDPKGLLGVIRKDIDAIHEKLNQPRHDEILPCICPDCNNDQIDSYHSYDKIKSLIKNHKTTIQCNIGNDVSISELLGEYGMNKHDVTDHSRQCGGDTFIHVEGDYAGRDIAGGNIAGRDINHTAHAPVSAGDTEPETSLGKNWFRPIAITVIGGLLVLILWHFITNSQNNQPSETNSPQPASQQVKGNSTPTNPEPSETQQTKSPAESEDATKATLEEKPVNTTETKKPAGT